MEALDVRPATAADREAIAGIVGSSWGGTTVVVHAAVYDALDLPALLATTRQRFDQLRVQGPRASLPYLGLDPHPTPWPAGPEAPARTRPRLARLRQQHQI